MGREIILTAAHHNWGLHSIDDWQKTFYILYDNGDLRVINYEGIEIREENFSISDNDLKFIRENIECFIRSDSEIDIAIGITIDGVKYHIRNLKKEGRIDRIGADRGGYWKVND